jgi:hypothetical protein
MLRQHPHVDAILEIGGGSEIGIVLAAERRHHLAKHAEADALEPRHKVLAPWRLGITAVEIVENPGRTR